MPLLLILLLIGLSFARDPFLDSLIAYVNKNAKSDAVKFGFSLRSVKTDSLIYNHNGNDWFVPASTLKLVTTASALQNIPLDYAPKTVIHLEGIRKNNVFSGALRIEGRGDPNVSARYYPNALFALNQMTGSIKSMGIDTVRGMLNLDTLFFKGPRKPPEWRKKFFDAWYGAEISPLSFNDNCALFEIKPGEQDGDSVLITIIPDVGYVKINNEIKTEGHGAHHKFAMDPVKPEITFSGTIGAQAKPVTLVLPIRNPAEYFKAAFFNSLAHSNIEFIEDSLVYKGRAIDSVVFAGPPLRSILDEVNQRSQNLHSEVLLRLLGQHNMREGSAESGIYSERLFLQNSGLPEADFKMVDGSGLSPQNSLKPNSLTKLLSYMKKQKNGDVYYASLAIPGISGAGKRVDIARKDKVRFKTGFIEGVHGLAGYVLAENDTLAFALYLNNAQRVNESLARDILDTLAGRIADRYNNFEAASLKEGKTLWESALLIKNKNERINYFSNKLKEKPYFLGPMGEGKSIYPSYKPRVNFREMDCVTYMEHVLALAYSEYYSDFFDNLQNIRYKNGVIDYNMRNHFLVADWIANNGFAMDDEHSMVSGQWVINKKKFFKDLNVANPTINISFLEKKKAIAFADTVRFARDSIFGVAILSEIPGLDAAHTGFVVASKSKPLMLRHASQLKGKVIEQPLSEFLKTTKIKTPGISFFKLEKGIKEDGSEKWKSL